MARLRFTLALLPITLAFAALPAHALECTWTGFSDNWTNPVRWSCGVVPDGDDHAIIPGGSVTVSVPQVVGALSHASGSLTTTANLTVNTAFTWTGGFVIGGSGAAVVLADATTSTMSNGVLHTDGRIENHGTFSLLAGASVGGTGTFDNRGTLELAGTNFNIRTLNSGSIRKTGAGTTTHGSAVTHTGSMLVEAGTLILNGSTSTMGGTSTVSSGAILRLGGATTHVAGGTIGGAGALQLNGGLHTVTGATTWSAATVTWTSGDIHTTLGSVTVSGAFAWNGGFLTGAGGHALILATSVNATQTAGVLHTDGRLENHGTVALPAGASVSGSGTFDNRGTLELAGANYSIRTLNSGTIRKTGAALTTHGSTFTNTGALVVEAGELRLNGGNNAVSGTVTISAGAVLRFGNTSTLQAGLTTAGAGTLEVAGTVTVLSAYAHPGLTNVVAGQAVFDNAPSVTFAALTHTGGFLDIQRPAATITGTFTRTGGTLRTTGNTLTFSGAGTQLLDLSVASTFAGLAVAPGTTLVEVQPASTATVSGALTNFGVIRKTRTMTAGNNPFGLTGVVLDVATLGSLASVQVDRRDVTHPLAGPDQQTGRFWTMTPVGAGFVLGVTLPHAVADPATTSACRLTGSTWDCGRTAAAPGLVSRTGLTALSDWTVGTNVTQTDTYSITGTILLNGSTPMTGVSVQLAGAPTSTSGAGTYSFDGLASGSYTVTPSLAGYAFAPATRSFTAITANQVGNFTAQRVWAITGTVRDLNDTGVAGITVNASGSATGSAVTDADGRYSLTGLPQGGSYVVAPAKVSFSFTPATHTFTNLTSDQVAPFFLAQVGTFTRYFAEGATSTFFDTEIALLNATGQATTATLTFLKADGTTVAHDVPLAGLARATVNPKQLAGLENAEFSTVITSTQPVIADRTMRWDARGYGSHAETSIAAPALEWYLAEGATIGGFNLFYLIQNPNATEANVDVTYLLPAPQAPIVKTYAIAPSTRFNIWVNLEAPELAAAEVSAVIRGTNNVPVIVERAMYRNNAGRTFDAGHESAGVTAPATEWFLAEGATGSYFDLFVLIANPVTTTAQVSVDYLLPGGTVLTKTYAVAPQSRFGIWVDFEDPQLASTAVSARVRSTNAVPIIVERAMWWPGDSNSWHEGHNSAGAERTSTKWGLADGQVGGTFSVETYILIANTSSTGGTAQVTLVFEDGTTVVRQLALLPNSRESVPVSLTFPEAAGRRFGAVVESFGAPAPEIVVERAMYGNAEGVVWAAGSNVVGTRLR